MEESNGGKRVPVHSETTNPELHSRTAIVIVDVIVLPIVMGGCLVEFEVAPRLC